MAYYLSSSQAAALDKFDKDMLAPFKRAYDADPKRSQKYTAEANWGGRAEVRFKVQADGIVASAFSKGAETSDRWGAECCGPHTFELGKATSRQPQSRHRAFVICGTAAAAVQAFHERHAGGYEVRFPSTKTQLCYLGDGTFYKATLVALDGSAEALQAWDPSDDRVDICFG